jgi:hypothetical protein
MTEKRLEEFLDSTNQSVLCFVDGVQEPVLARELILLFFRHCIKKRAILRALNLQEQDLI